MTRSGASWGSSRRVNFDVMVRDLAKEVTSRARVLIVDDNVELVGALHAVLMTSELRPSRAQKMAIEVVTASCGDEGLSSRDQVVSTWPSSTSNFPTSAGSTSFPD